jgi:predicted CoA-binding protein
MTDDVLDCPSNVCLCCRHKVVDDAVVVVVERMGIWMRSGIDDDEMREMRKESGIEGIVVERGILSMICLSLVRRT